MQTTNLLTLNQNQSLVTMRQPSLRCYSSSLVVGQSMLLCLVLNFERVHKAIVYVHQQVATLQQLSLPFGNLLVVFTGYYHEALPKPISSFGKLPLALPQPINSFRFEHNGSLLFTLALPQPISSYTTASHLHLHHSFSQKLLQRGGLFGLYTYQTLIPLNVLCVAFEFILGTNPNIRNGLRTSTDSDHRRVYCFGS